MDSPTSATHGSDWHVTELVTRNPQGNIIGDGGYLGEQRAMSADGRYVVFQSQSSVVPGDGGDEYTDVYVRDRQTGAVELISNPPGNVPGNEDSSHGSISYNGRYVVFDSQASNLVPNDTNEGEDSFLYDRETGEMARINVKTGGGQTSMGFHGSGYPVVSDDGNTIVFESYREDVVPGVDGSSKQVYVHNRQANTTTYVGLTPGGQIGTSDSEDADLSGDGRFVAFESNGSGLTADDNDTTSDIFVRDMLMGVTELISGDAGLEGNDRFFGPAISADGRFVTFYGSGVSTGNVFVYDRLADTIVNVTPGDLQGAFPVVNHDGRFVAYHTFDNDGEILVWDRTSGTAQKANSAFDGGLADAYTSGPPSINEDGSLVLFVSFATNLVPNDSNGSSDVFLAARPADTTPSPSPTPSPTPTTSPAPSVSATPTPPSGTFVWGNVNCTGGADPIDALSILRYDAGQSVAAPPSCPDIGQGLGVQPAALVTRLWGDVDCSANVDPVDGLKILRFDAGLSVTKVDPACPDIGQSVSTATGPTPSPPTPGSTNTPTPTPTGLPTATPTSTPTVTPTPQPTGGTPTPGATGNPAGVSATFLNCNSNPEVFRITNSGTQPVSMAGFLVRSDPGQEFDLGTVVASIGAGQTIELQSDSAAADSPGAGIYRLTGNALYRNSDSTDYARLVRPNATLSQLNCQPPVTPTPTTPPGSNQCANLPTPLTIPDNDNQTGATLFGQFQDTDVISDLDVCININHTYIGDLFVQITHLDSGTSVTLLNINVSCSGDNIRVLLDDEAGSQADNVCGPGTPAINGTYRPTESLSAFDGEMLGGDWEVKVFDTFPGDTGTVLGALLIYTVAN